MSLQTNISFYNSRTAMYVFYSVLSLVVFVVVSPYFVYQALRYKKYIGSLRQRLGFLPISFNIDGEDSIWIHAVSVGEALTARALAADLKARYPRLRLFVSTTTIAGQQVARRSLSNAEAVFYFPFDWTFIVRRILTLVRPRLFIMMETEIWPNLLRECRRRGVKAVIVAGSTMRGEETAVLRAFGRIKTAMPGALAILAPRHPERFSEVERIARDAGFITIRRSELPIDAEPRADVVVLDSIGELAQIYQVATAVFVGGSLVDHGGHNILEPAVFGKPIVFGPHMHNFREIADAFVSNDAAVQVPSDRELEGALLALVTDPVRRARLGAAARALVEANRGAKTKTLEVITELLPDAGVGGHGRAVVRPFRLVH